MTVKLEVKVTDNSSKLIKRIGRWRRGLLEQFGEDFKDELRDTLKESPATSRSGNAPNVHSGEPNLETAEYEINDDATELIAGPVLLQSSRVYPALPGLLEQGGYARIAPRRRSSNSKRNRSIRKYYARRPFVLPTAQRALQKFKENARRGP